LWAVPLVLGSILGVTTLYVLFGKPTRGGALLHPKESEPSHK
jgi:hypothetical protein